MRDEWTEADVLALAQEESDSFDRKSGGSLGKSNDERLNTLAKAVSAFANSGGGTLVIGVEDDGSISGVDPYVGKATTKDWFEQTLPNLVSYPLVLFRVHTVRTSEPSAIPPGKVLIVVEIGDSPAAPHQSARDQKYYHRAGGRSEPARHFYIELLRQRLTGPALDFVVEKFEPMHVDEYEGCIFLEAKLKCIVKNMGRVAAYKWVLAADVWKNPGYPFQLADRLFVDTANFPVRRARDANILIDDAILPGRSLRSDIDVAFKLSPLGSSSTALRNEIAALIQPMMIDFQLATETSPGDVREISLRDFVDVEALARLIETWQAPPA